MSLRGARRVIASSIVGAALTLPGCSSEQPGRVPTEQEIHADDRGIGGVSGRHVFNCDDGSRLLVDYKQEGLTLELRDTESQRPMVLTAPSQGLQFRGEAGTVTIVTGGLRFRSTEGLERTCKRQTR